MIPQEAIDYIEQTEPVDELIYTKYGYIPLSKLNFDTTFEDQSGFSVIPTLTPIETPEGIVNQVTFECVKEGHIICVNTYYLKDTGEKVKESRHIYLFKGLDLGVAQGILG